MLLGSDRAASVRQLSPFNECCTLPRSLRPSDLVVSDTRAGAIIVAMNPFTPVDTLYTDEQLRLYRDAANSDDPEPFRSRGLPPHLFEIAARAHARVQRKEPQAIVINGESGAGKTESTKSVLLPVSACTLTRRTSTWALVACGSHVHSRTLVIRASHCHSPCQSRACWVWAGCRAVQLLGTCSWRPWARVARE